MSPTRWYLRKRGEKSYNLAIINYQSEEWYRYIKFRNYLRTFPEEANNYGKHKEEIVNNGTNTLFDYFKNKSDYISELLERVNKWSGN